MQTICIKWQDSNIIEDQTDVSPNIAIIKTCGFLVRENEKSVIVARDIILGEYRGQIIIPRENIIKVRKSL